MTIGQIGQKYGQSEKVYYLGFRDVALCFDKELIFIDHSNVIAFVNNRLARRAEVLNRMTERAIAPSQNWSN